MEAARVAEIDVFLKAKKDDEATAALSVCQSTTSKPSTSMRTSTRARSRAP